MLNKFRLVAPILLSATLAVGGAAQASEVSVDSLQQVQSYSAGLNGASNDQVTSVSQLSDVRPTDWAFQALQSLVERYGCIAGYPDRTYRGNRALTRYEFAAGLNACLDRVNELIAASTADMASKDDLETLRKLQVEFASELATLKGRVNSLEGKVATLEKQQFSTTTKLRGEVIFSLAGALGDEKAAPARTSDSPAAIAADAAARAARPDVDENTTFSYRARLSLSTSFTGKDELFTRLQARNTPDFAAATGTNAARLAYEGTGDGSLAIDRLYYRMPVGDGGKLTIDAAGGQLYGNVDTFNPYLASSGLGSISRFGRFNPIYRYGAGGAGATLDYPVTKNIKVALGFLADNANDPTVSNGLFSGSSGALAQIGFKPNKNLQLGLTYVRGYDRANNVDVTGGTGSALARRPFGNGVATTSNNFGVEANFRVTPAIAIGGWAGLTRAYASKSSNDATILNWAVNASFPDLGKKGNLGAITFGMPPKLTDRNVGIVNDEEKGTTYHLEALYRYQLNDKVSITPGVLYIINPENNNDNNNILVGTVRTVFTF